MASITASLAKEFPTLKTIFGIREGAVVLPLQWVAQNPRSFTGRDLVLVEDDWEDVAVEIMPLSAVWELSSSEKRKTFVSKFVSQIVARGAMIIEVPADWGIAVKRVSKLSTTVFKSNEKRKQALVYRDPASGYMHGWDKAANADGSKREYIQVRASADWKKLQFPKGTVPPGLDDALFDLFLLYRNASISTLHMLTEGLDLRITTTFERVFGHPMDRLGLRAVSEDYYRALRYHNNEANSCAMDPHADVGMMTVSPLLATAGLEALQPTHGFLPSAELALPVRQWNWQKMEGYRNATLWIVYVGEVAAQLFATKLRKKYDQTFWPLLHRVCLPTSSSTQRQSLPYFQRIHGDSWVGKNKRMREFWQELKTRSYNQFQFDRAVMASGSMWASAFGNADGQMRTEL